MMMEKSEILTLLMSFLVLRVTWNIPTITHKCSAYRNKNHFYADKDCDDFQQP